MAEGLMGVQTHSLSLAVPPGPQLLSLAYSPAPCFGCRAAPQASRWPQLPGWQPRQWGRGWLPPAAAAGPPPARSSPPNQDLSLLSWLLVTLPWH